MHLTEWRTIIGASAKEYCSELCTSALTLQSDAAFRFLSDSHTALDDVLTKMQSALNNILEASGTSCKEYKAGEIKIGPIKACVSAVFDLWEVVAESEDEHPTALATIMARDGFKFQHWGADDLYRV